MSGALQDTRSLSHGEVKQHLGNHFHDYKKHVLFADSAPSAVGWKTFWIDLRFAAFHLVIYSQTWATLTNGLWPKRGVVKVMNAPQTQQEISEVNPVGQSLLNSPALNTTGSVWPHWPPEQYSPIINHLTPLDTSKSKESLLIYLLLFIEIICVQAVLLL